MTITLNFGEEGSKRLKSLSQLNGTYDPEHTVRRALAVYALIQKQMTDHNATVIIRYPDGRWSELVIK